MQKKTKRIITLTILILIILIISILILNKSKQMPETLNEQAQAQYTTTIGEQVFDITNAVTETPNSPTISAGMIPVKWEGTYWTITSADDEKWYNYSNGQPAYIMLNDGTYQSELVRDMEGKKLAEKNIGSQIQEAELGTIYMWLPRFAYNEQGEILHIKQACSVAGTWNLPDIFIHETEKIDFSLAGTWVEYTPLSSTSEVTTKVQNMNIEENTYGFIANTVSIDTNTDPNIQTILQTYTDNLTANVVGVDAHIDPINDQTNLNRTILKITNTNHVEPIKGTAYYDETEGKIKIETIYRTNAISKILDKKGKILSENSTTADTGDEVIGNKTYYYIVIDNKNNAKSIKAAVTGLDIYIIENEEDLKYFRDAVNAGKTTEITKAYQIADVEINHNKYTINEETGEITFAEDAEQWTPIGKSSTYSYKGDYYGGDYSISGIYINTTSDYQGLFGYIDGCCIQDLKLNNSSIKGGKFVGGIVGYSYGKNSNSILNCCNKGNIETIESHVGGIVGAFSSTDTNDIIKGCYNTGKINSVDTYVGGIIGHANNLTIEECYNLGIINSEGSYVGGIIGNANDTEITNCYNEAQINTEGGNVGGICGYAHGNANGTKVCNISKSYNKGNITSQSSAIGGITGASAYGTIANCYNVATIKSVNACGGITGTNHGTIYNCYNVGEISYTSAGNSSSSYAGGICGGNTYGTIKNSYNKGDIKGNRRIGGIVGEHGYIFDETKYSYINNCVNATENITGNKWMGAICGYKNSKYSQINSSKYLKNTSLLNGIGLLSSSAGGTVNTGCTAYSDITSMPTMLAVINGDNAFVEDTEGINNGYPILAWQVKTSE